MYIIIASLFIINIVLLIKNNCRSKEQYLKMIEMERLRERFLFIDDMSETESDISSSESETEQH